MSRPYTTIEIRITSRGTDNLNHNELPWVVEVHTHAGEFNYVELFADVDSAYDFAQNFLALESR